MLVDITEEERDFLEHMCIRAEVFAMRGLGQRPFEKDLRAIKFLKNKFRELNANLINHETESDN